MWCKPNGHDWNKWARPIESAGTNRKQQWRECKTCGKAQMRMMQWDHASNLTDVNKSLDKVIPETE